MRENFCRIFIIEIITMINSIIYSEYAQDIFEIKINYIIDYKVFKQNQDYQFVYYFKLCYHPQFISQHTVTLYHIYCIIPYCRIYCIQPYKTHNYHKMNNIYTCNTVLKFFFWNISGQIWHEKIKAWIEQYKLILYPTS